MARDDTHSHLCRDRQSLVRAARYFLGGFALVMYVTNGVALSNGKGNIWPAVILGMMATGAYITLTVLHWQDLRRK